MRRSSVIALALVLSFAAGLSQAETKRLAAKPAAESAVVELGKIGTSAPSGDDKKATLKQAPSKQAAIAALKAKGNANATLGPTWRVTPRTLYDPHIGVLLWCTDAASMLSTRGNGNSWQCQSGQSNEMWFDFRQLAANSTYLVTISHNFGGSIDVVTEVNGQEQTTNIEPPADPQFLVFQTGAGQTTATLKIRGIRGGAYQSSGSWYSLELAKVQ